MSPDVTWLETFASVSVPVYPGAASCAVNVPDVATGSVVEVLNGTSVALGLGAGTDFGGVDPLPHATTESAALKSAAAVHTRAMLYTRS